MKREFSLRSILFLVLFPIVFQAKGQDRKILELGRQSFQSCVACHGPDGKGVQAGDLLMAPNLNESAFVKGKHVDLLAAIVLKGILKVDNKYVQAMLPLEAVLNDEQMAALLTYVMREFGGHDDVLVEPTEINKLRKTYLTQASPYRRSDLEAMLKAAEAPELLSDLSYSIYSGQWTKLPDFSKLTPEKTGKLKKNLITLAPAKDIKKGFGMVFEATLTVPTTEIYQFTLSSDDGSALAIDGEGLIDHDGIHPKSPKQNELTLDAGKHTLKVLYFERSGQRGLALSAKTKSMGEILFSAEKATGGGKKQSYDPILLTARKPGEAIVHRAYLPDSKPRAIGVGYPDGINIVWDADTMNLAYLWRGDFIDAASHWNGRGSGSTPMGGPKTKTAQGFALQVLESLDEPWVPYSTDTIAYERDNADPKKDITFDVENPAYQFLGYRLDENRFPTFRYRFLDATVTDTFTPEMDGPLETITRTVALEGAPGENVYLRLADSGSLEKKNNWYDIGGGMEIKVDSHDPIVRASEGEKELLVQVSDNWKATIHYRWKDARKATP